MKKIAWLLSLILCVATLMICPPAQAAQEWEMISPYLRFQGGNVYYGAYENGQTWTLNQGTGERKYTSPIDCKDSYVIPPNVIVSLTGIDGDNKANSRINVVATNVTETGFDIEYKTWADTKITSLWSSWTALGE